MQKTSLNYLFIAFVIIAFGLLFIIGYHQIHQPQTPVTKAQHPVLIVDYNNDSALNETELLKGEDAILAIRPPTKNGTASNEIFNSYDALKRLDANKDRRLDKTDPMFPYLELVFLNNDGKNRKHLSLNQAEITAIVFTQQPLKEVNPYRNNPLVGYAIKSDGKKLAIRLVPVSLG